MSLTQKTSEQLAADEAFIADEDEHDPDEDGFLAYERHLEDRGWADKFAEEQHMLSYGPVPLEML